MNKKDDPNSIWYEGPFFEEDPQQTRWSTVRAPLRLVHAEASLAGTGAMRATDTTVQVVAAPLTAVGGLAADAVPETSSTPSGSPRRRRPPVSGRQSQSAKAAGARPRPAVASGPAAIPTPPTGAAALAADPAEVDVIATLHELLGTPEPSKGESLVAYNRLYAAVRGAMQPRDFIDEMDVREIVDAAWVLRQYKSGRAGALDGAFEDAVADVIKDMLSEAWIRTNAKHRGAGDSAAHAKMRQALARAGLSEETLRGRVLEEHLDSVERIETLIDRLLDRRARLLQEMARRRDRDDPPE
jgi:hypothetical protein